MPFGGFSVGGFRTEIYMSRKKARDYAYKLVFEWLFNKDNSEQSPTMDSIFEDSEITVSDKDYIKTVVNGVAENFDDLRALIEENSRNFKMERIFKPDLAALLLATYEIKFMPDIPPAVSISEILDIVKIYSMPDSYVFVNGVLAGVLKQIGGKN